MLISIMMLVRHFISNYVSKSTVPHPTPLATSPRIIRHDAKLSSVPRFWLEGCSTMSFSPPAAAFKAQALNRVERFHPDDTSTPSSSTPGNNSSFGDLFTTTTMTSGGGTTTTTTSAHQHQQRHGFDVPDPFRKFPSSVNVAAAANAEFNNELLMDTLLGSQGDRSSPNGHHHHHGHHHTHHQQQHQHQQQYEDPTA